MGRKLRLAHYRIRLPSWVLLIILAFISHAASAPRAAVTVPLGLTGNSIIFKNGDLWFFNSRDGTWTQCVNVFLSAGWPLDGPSLAGYSDGCGNSPVVIDTLGDEFIPTSCSACAEYQYRLNVFSAAGYPQEKVVRFSSATVLSASGNIFVGNPVSWNQWTYLTNLNAAVLGVPGGAPAAPLRIVSVENPTKGHFSIHFELPGASDAKVELFDAQGRLVTEQDLPGLAAGAQTHQVSGTGSGRTLSPGSYVLRISAAGQSASTKLVIVR